MELLTLIQFANFNFGAKNLASSTIRCGNFRESRNLPAAACCIVWVASCVFVCVATSQQQLVVNLIAANRLPCAYLIAKVG